MHRAALVLFLIATAVFPAPCISQTDNLLIRESDPQTAYILETGDDALLARLYLFRTAIESIDIQSFIWQNDLSGRFMLHELFKAARRGVRVRLLIDDLTVRKNASYIPFLATLHPNLSIKQYNPVAQSIKANPREIVTGYLIKFGNANRRMHNKVIIVDNRFGITGGRNFADDYFDRGVERTFKDRDLLIAGEVAKEMTESFDAYWDFDLSVASEDMKDIDKKILKGDIQRPSDLVDYEHPPEFDQIISCAETPNCIERRLTNQGFSIQSASFIADKPGHRKRKDISRTTASLIELMDNAETAISVQTPYLVTSKLGKKLFKGKRKATPDIDILVSTNSLAASDHFYAYAFSYKNKKRYVKDYRWRVFEFKPTPADIDTMVPPIEGIVRAKSHYVCMHAKTFVFDHHTMWLGSFNIDPRSAALNTEAGFLVKDAALAKALESLIRIDASPRNSWTIGIHNRMALVSFANGVAEDIFKMVPFLNIWPFSYSSSFELRPGATEVPFYDPTFYDNYRSVGQFPGLNVSTKAIKTRLTKAFFGPAEPII
jgi:cardiolipin synthase C